MEWSFHRNALNSGGDAIQDGPERYLDVGRQMGISEFSCGKIKKSSLNYLALMPKSYVVEKNCH